MKFSDALTYYRERQGLNKTELAKKIDVQPEYIVGIEKARFKPPTPDRLEQICKALGLDDGERKKLFQLAYEERLKDSDLAFHEAIGEPSISPKTIEVKNQRIPVVSMAKGDDIEGFEFEQLEKHEYEYIDFDGCLASKVMSNSMAPTLFKGQRFIYDPNLTPIDGDLAYIKLKSGEEYVKRFRRDVKRKLIVLESVNTANHGTLLIAENDIKFIHCVVGSCYTTRRK